MFHFLSMNTAVYVTLGVSVFLGLLISIILWVLSYVIAIQSPDSEKVSAYECGFEPFEDARNRFDVRFYIVAILFLIFDVEVAFLLPWGVTLGLTGFMSYTIIVAFLVLLIIGFVYEVVKGALNLH
jgi:NADH-quinone oxidoreductase subunit A